MKNGITKLIALTLGVSIAIFVMLSIVLSVVEFYQKNGFWWTVAIVILAAVTTQITVWVQKKLWEGK